MNREQLIKKLGLPKEATDEQIIAACGQVFSAVDARIKELEHRLGEADDKIIELKESRATPTVAGGLSREQEKIVREKMVAGLTREQALETLRTQEAWDADPKNPKNAKAK
jgi:hypothetical protein